MIAGKSNHPSVQIFIGAPIEYRSEFECLMQVHSALSKCSGWAIIFANFQVGGRQIDLAVFTNNATIVIEAKHYAKPVSGGENGLWEQLGPHGVKKVGNAYIQALNAKNALRDAMPVDVSGYPNALVLITPEIPKGSRLPSDFKVCVTGLDQTAMALTKSSGALLTRVQCEVFAQHLRMEKVTDIEAALDERVLNAERTHRAYADAFRAFHEPASNVLIGDDYYVSETKVCLSEAESLILSQELTTLVVGPSGCGKSLLLTSCAVGSIKKNYTPLFVEAKNFEGDFQRFLDKEVSLLGTLSARELVYASKLVNAPLVLFLDGYNECQQTSKLHLTRSLRAFALRHDARIAISTQHELVRPDLLKTITLNVNRPSDELKRKLARSDATSDGFENLHDLLEVASSGLEASLVGKVRGLLRPGSSKFQVFDTFVRFKLGATANEGVRVLSALADTLVTRVCFSLSTREFDRICDAVNLTPSGRKQLLESKLLRIRGDKVSFVHELFFAVYSAEAALRSVNGELERMRTTLTSPRFVSSRVLIVGAVEDETLLSSLLENIDDQELLAACARGECGVTAQSFAKSKIFQLLDAMLLETRTVTFQFTDDEWHTVKLNSHFPNFDNKVFSAYQGAIADGLMNGQYLDTIMSAILELDSSIAKFLSENAAEAKLKKIAIRHEVFSAAYVMNGHVAISQLVSRSHGGGIRFRRSEGLELAPALCKAWGQAITDGQFYFLLGLTRRTAFNNGAAPHIATLLRRVKLLPYHLQLALFDFTQYLSDAGEPFRTEIIALLDAALNQHGIMLNTVIFEALSRLHAMEEEEQAHVPTIREEIRCALDEDTAEADQAAWALFSCQFDHPFDSAYWEEIQSLDSARKKILLTKACRGADGCYVSFLGILIRELAAFGEHESATVIERWTCLPAKNSVMPQDAVEVFVNAHEALGRLKAKLPTTKIPHIDEADRALLACGELFYWANMSEIRVPEQSQHTFDAQAALLEQCLHTAASALQLTSSWMLSDDGKRYSLVKHYPRMCAAISRSVLERKTVQRSYFNSGLRSDPASISIFTIHMLGETGGVCDLPLLRSFCDDEQCGTAAIEAVKAIEERRNADFEI